MQVNLLSYTKNPQLVIYASARQCYSKSSAHSIFTKSDEVDSDKVKSFVNKLMKRGHLSPLEHVSFTFAIEGISRVCTHQLVRHRIASFSQQSQRYVDMKDFKVIVPPLIEQDEEVEAIFHESIDKMRDYYFKMRQKLEEKGLGREEVNQDLRFILPQATEAKIVVTMNARELLHFFGERLCLRAQWEIRALAAKMLALARGAVPEVFADAGAKCKLLGYCPENNQDCPLYKQEA
jgi:thymidylate synthase (FAD)